MGVLAGYPLSEVRRAMLHGHLQMTVADLLGNPLPADLIAAQGVKDIRIAWRHWLGMRIKITDEYNRIPTRTQSALLTVMGDNYAEMLDQIPECPDAAWFLTAARRKASRDRSSSTLQSSTRCRMRFSPSSLVGRSAADSSFSRASSNTAGNRVDPGGRGEVTLTGGFNFCLPLLRYRTGDFASLDCSGTVPILRDFSGRPPVLFRSASGEWLNNIEVTHALRLNPLPQWAMHQSTTDAVTFRHSGSPSHNADTSAALAALLGDIPIEVKVTVFDDKVVQYTSDLTCP